MDSLLSIVAWCIAVGCLLCTAYALRIAYDAITTIKAPQKPRRAKERAVRIVEADELRRAQFEEAVWLEANKALKIRALKQTTLRQVEEREAAA